MVAESRLVLAVPMSVRAVHVNLAAGAQLIVASIGLMLILRFRDQLLALDFASLCALSTIYAVALIALSSLASPAGLWSPASAYLGLLTLFHFGLVGVYGFGLLSDDASRMYSVWFLASSTPYAVILAVLGVNACAIGAALACLTYRDHRKAAERPAVISPGDTSLTSYLTLIGGVLVVLGVAGWFGIVVLSGGPGLLLSSYGDYLDATKGAPVSYVWVALGFGLSFLTGTSGPRPSRVHRLAYGLFALFALFALPLGLRGEVLFTSLAAVIVRARRGRVPSLATSVIGVILVLVMISAIRDFRQVGFAADDPAAVHGNVLDGLTELGASLRPVGLVTSWHDRGEAFIHGQSYWAPIDRASCRILPARRCLPAVDDERLMNILVQKRAGPIGFSPIAEAFRNYGQTGVMVVMGIIGIVVGLLSRWSSTPLRNAITGVMLVELFINVRNDFTALPAHIVLGLACVLGAVLLDRFVPLGRIHRDHIAMPSAVREETR